MITIYFILGLLAAFIGALPLGASNIIVINTTLKHDAKQALKIAFAAGLAEVILSFYALHCNTIVQSFIEKNQWLQIIIVLILLCIGAYLFFKKQKEKNSKKKKIIQSKYLTGFLSGILNPPVLVYWLVAIGYINDSMYMLSLQSSIAILFLFFIGVYLGKVLTLYLYSKFSLVIKNKVQNITLVVNKVTGVLLIIIAMINTAKIYFI
ncbi:LysE family transporter [uncultured Lacinutrix sp.]|uniref:LysE family transporter n=1 Tax=uncultured Lacinutrix sp. TaxID=574032 RepID=UPI002636B1D9|nr:LysE family transporter [uncultured Lacinutrix sp.]